MEGRRKKGGCGWVDRWREGVTDGGREDERREGVGG